MPQTIGHKLRDARERKGYSIEDVAHDTRIPSTTLRNLENDDYSGFAGTTYARSFLSLYSRHLGIDASEALREFNTGSVPRTREGGISYLHSVTKVSDSFGRTPPMPSQPAQSPAVGPAHPFLLGLIVLVLLILIPLFYYFANKAESIDDVSRLVEEAVQSSGKPGEGEKPEPAPQASAEKKSPDLANNNQLLPSARTDFDPSPAAGGAGQVSAATPGNASNVEPPRARPVAPKEANQDDAESSPEEADASAEASTGEGETDESQD